MTRANMITRIRVDEAFNDTGIVSDASLQTLLNEACVDLAKRGKAFILNAAIDAVASQREYVLSGASPVLTNFLDVDWDAGGVYYKPTSTTTKYHPNDFKILSREQLDMHYPGWQESSASDTLIALYFAYNTSGYLVMGTHPKPSTSTPDYQVYFLGRGTDMTNDAHYPWTGSTVNLVHLEPYHPVIVYYVMEVLYRTKIGGAEGNKKADEYLKLYRAGAEEMRLAQERIFYAEQYGLTKDGMLTATQSFGSA